MSWWWIAAALAATALWLLTAFLLGQQRRRGFKLELDRHLAQTRAEELQQQLDELRAVNRGLVEDAPAAMFLLDREGRVPYFNGAAAALFRLAQGVSEGKQLIELVRDHELAGLVRRVLDQEIHDASVEVQPPGSRLVLQATARAIRAHRGDLLGAAVIIEDLTDVRRMEAARRDLVANVSHELRTPLAGMKALVETLESGVDDREIAATFLAKIHGEIDRLALLVRDLLELSRIESGGIRLEPRPADLQDVLSEAVNRMRPVADDAAVAVELLAGESTRVLIDRGRGEQIAVNLLQNAIKFTPAGGHVYVSWSIEDRQALVNVRDTGIGLSSEDLPRVFERFYKADKGRAYSNSSGTGLGLAIVKHLTNAMGGRVWADSTPGAGSTFSFSLPLAPPAFTNVLHGGKQELTIES